MCLWQYLKLTLLEMTLLEAEIQIVYRQYEKQLLLSWFIKLNWTDLESYHINLTVEIIPASVIDKIYQIRIYKSVFLF